MANNTNGGPGNQGPTIPIWGSDEDGNPEEVAHTHESFEKQLEPGEHEIHIPDENGGEQIDHYTTTEDNW
jgi:hypothetical protein